MAAYVLLVHFFVVLAFCVVNERSLRQAMASTDKVADCTIRTVDCFPALCEGLARHLPVIPRV